MATVRVFWPTGFVLGLGCVATLSMAVTALHRHGPTFCALCVVMALTVVFLEAMWGRG